MTLYTEVPMEQILEGMDKLEHLMEMEYQGITMKLRPLDGQRMELVRIISPNPQDYINPAYTPGTVVHLQIK